MAISDTVIAFDFDGVISVTNGFNGHDDIQKPNPEVVTVMHKLREAGIKVMIHSTRGNAFLEMYCEKFSIPYDYINQRPDVAGENPGKPIAWVYIDDRALNYHGQDADTLLEEIKRFRPHRG
ncbi:hypothetical protein HYV30_03330 [Candidatus Kaiserbacteria bacterium]|nr:hypothetical protein [Candidatus Kaiserbacteria bacterium]